MEISAIFGKARMDKCAAIHNRTFLSNLPSIDHEGKSLESIVLVSNPDLWNHQAFPPPKPLFLDDPFYEPPPNEAQHRHEIEQALDLLKRCLALDPCRRLTAADALKHPWLRRPGVDEDKDGPRKPKEGVCKHMHRIEEGGIRAYALSCLLVAHRFDANPLFPTCRRGLGRWRMARSRPWRCHRDGRQACVVQALLGAKCNWG